MTSPTPEPRAPEPDDEAVLVQEGYRYAFALTHHREEAEDLVQEAWVRLTRKYAGVESRPLLFRTIRNLFLDACRRRKVIQFEPEEAAEGVAAEGTPDTQGIRGELETLLSVLHPVEREVLHLHFYLGHTAEEIGELLDKPRGTVLSLLHRAIAKLRVRASDLNTPGDGCNRILLSFVVLLEHSISHLSS